MITNAKLKQRLERLEYANRAMKRGHSDGLMQLTLAKLSDEDLAILKCFLRRGAPLSSRTPDERGALDHWVQAHEMVQRDVLDQRLSRACR